jgi:hypothetical protein
MALIARTQKKMQQVQQVRTILKKMKTFNQPLPELKFDKNRFRVKNCPCGKSNKDGKFIPYIGHENKGYCHSCGETFLPELPKVEQWNSTQPTAYQPRIAAPQPKQASYISNDIFLTSLQAYSENNFVLYLKTLFGLEVCKELIKRYNIGTSNHWNGATVFWLIDAQHKIRTGKIMLYNPTTGKRVQQPYDHINWVHYMLKLPEFEKKVCLFGEHLLNDKTKPVAIVESEKTAVIASVYYPQFIWLASGGKDGLNAEKCSVLKGRSVTLFPDVDAFEKWSAKARELKHIAKFNVSDLLERKATEAERKGKFDIADYLIRFDYQPKATEPPPAVQEVPILPTKEELQYSKMVSRTPSIEMLVRQLGLVSATTGKPLNKFEV